MNEAQRNAALQELKALRKAAADLAGRAQGLEQLLTAAPEAAAAAAADDYAIGQCPPPESLSPFIREGKAAADWAALVGQDLPTAVLQGRQAERLLAEVIRVYSAFPEVRAIAVGQDSDEILICVLTPATKHYDGELIGRLIAGERDLKRQFKPLCLSPDYAAVGDPGISESWYRVGAIIWRRDSGNGE